MTQQYQNFYFSPGMYTTQPMQNSNTKATLHRITLVISGVISAIIILSLSTWIGYLYQARQAISPVLAHEEHTTSPTPHFLPPPLGVQEVVRAAMPSCVFIMTKHGLGSGFFISDDGYIVTNFHIVDDDSRVLVFDNNYTLMIGKIIGKDAISDLAVIKVATNQKTTAVRYGSSQKLEVGSQVIAVGNPFAEYFTVTSGILSAKDRGFNIEQSNGTLTAYPALQTDAATNPGNSGGPLFNTNAELIGINDAMTTSELTERKNGARSSIGIAFAIPIDDALPIINRLRSGLHIERPHIGLQFQHPSPDNFLGAFVNILPGPFTTAGLSGNILITAVDHRRVVSFMSLLGYLNFKQPGDTIIISYRQNSVSKNTSVTLTRA